MKGLARMFESVLLLISYYRLRMIDRHSLHVIQRQLQQEGNGPIYLRRQGQ